MKLQNFRYGFATNSSSTHSIIYVDPEHPMASQIRPDWSGDAYFGWENFTLVKKDAKLQYLGQIIKEQVGGWMGVAAATYLLGIEVDKGGHIDHQSLFGMPLERTPYTDTLEISRDFVQEFVDWVLQDDVVILGGNDNSEGHPLFDVKNENKISPMDVMREIGYGNAIARKDGSFWTLFNPSNGNKGTFSFVDGSAPTRPKTPELVDIKITDYCPFGCAFCYMGSTTEGSHAEAKYLFDLLRRLSNMDVLEVALGGGEPTLHPHFVQILRRARECNIVPNFTTKNLGWLQGDEAEEILDLCGSFAYSVGSVKEMEKFVEACKNTYQGTVHYVMGSTPLDEFEEILKMAQETYRKVTLLGYKTTGRGDQFKPHDHKGWVDVVAKGMDDWMPSIGIDTVLASDYEEEIQATLGTPKWLYYTQEGWRSMYVDAVAQKAGPSSFCDEIHMREVTSLYDLQSVWDHMETLGR